MAPSSAPGAGLRNDGHSRLGAEDGLVFGSVHPTMALELVVWLKRVEYQGAIYFDTFPHNEDGEDWGGSGAGSGEAEGSPEVRGLKVV